MRTEGIVATRRPHVLLWGQIMTRWLQGRHGGLPVQDRGIPGIGGPAMRAHRRTGAPAERLCQAGALQHRTRGHISGHRPSDLPEGSWGQSWDGHSDTTAIGGSGGRVRGIENKRSSGGSIHGTGTPGVQGIVRRAVCPMPKDGPSRKGQRRTGRGCFEDQWGQVTTTCEACEAGGSEAERCWGRGCGVTRVPPHVGGWRRLKGSRGGQTRRWQDPRVLPSDSIWVRRGVSGGEGARCWTPRAWLPSAGL